MAKTTTQIDYAQQLIEGHISWRDLPSDWSESQRAHVRMTAVSQVMNDSSLTDLPSENDLLVSALGKNCENMVGMVGVPLGVVGPVKLQNTPDFFIPLATTEGALVASASRGMKAINLSKQTGFYIDDRGMTRAPVFVVESISQAEGVIEWIYTKEALEALSRVARETSQHLTLLKIHHKLVGRNLFLKFFFDTQAAMGMNMATIATEKLTHYIESRFEIVCVSLSGNGCVDKKPSWGSVIEGRGMYVQAETTIPHDVLKNILKTDADRIVEIVVRKNYVGGATFGSMGFNAHFANMVSAFYLATGQDMAHVVEGSVGITTAEKVKDDLYFSVTLPNILVGVVGGGTRLPYQKRSLSMMGIRESTSENKKKLAQNVAHIVMAGELSLLASLANRTLSKAHAQLARGSNV